MHYNIAIDTAYPQIKSANRKETYQKIAPKIARDTRQSEKYIYDLLADQKNNTCFCIGDGVMIAQTQIKALQKRFVSLSTLQNPITIQNSDQTAIDIICVFLSPEHEGNIHLRGLSRISRLLRDKQLQQRLRDAQDSESIKSLVNDPEGWFMAA